MLVAALSLLAVSALAGVARAQQAPSSPPMTDAMVAHIRQVCVAAQGNLGRIRASDALLRINQGQALQSISTSLMAPFNSRVALNQLDSGMMTSITSTFATELDTFRSDYQQYEEATSKAIQIDCVKQPVEFYDAVTNARTKRSIVHTDMLALQKSLRDYRSSLDGLDSQIKKGA